MKRVISSALSFLLILAVITAQPAQAAPDAQTLLDAYRAYYDVLMAAADEHGIGHEGISYAELVDFGGDGFSELLFTVYETHDFYDEHANLYVYGYSDFFELYYQDSIYRYWEVYGRSVGIDISHYGNVYLRVFVGGENGHLSSYYSIVNGRWVTELTLSIVHWGGEVPENGVLPPAEYRVNDVLVSPQVYQNALQSELGITGDTRWIDREPDTVQSTLYELQSRIAALEAALANPSAIPNAHPGPSPYSIIPDPERESDGRIGDWNAETERYEITGLPGDVSDQIMYMDAPFELFHSFYINGVMQERDVHYTVEEGSTRVTVVAQTIADLENGDHTAEAAFSRTDGSGLLDIVAQDFTVNLTRPAAAGGDGGQPGAQPLAADGQIPAALQSAPARNGNILPLVIGVVAIMLAGGGILYVVVVRNKKAKLIGEPDVWQPAVSQSPVPPQRPAMDAAGQQKAAPAVFCVNCGVKLLERARFCQNCGKQL